MSLKQRLFIFVFGLILCSAHGDELDDVVDALQKGYLTVSEDCAKQIEYLNTETFPGNSLTQYELVARWKALQSSTADDGAAISRYVSLERLKEYGESFTDSVIPQLGKLLTETKDLIDRTEREKKDYQQTIRGLLNDIGELEKKIVSYSDSFAFKELIEKPTYSIDAGIRAVAACNAYVEALTNAHCQISEALEASASEYLKGDWLRAKERLVICNYGGSDAFFVDGDKMREEQNRLDAQYGSGQYVPDLTACARGNRIDFKIAPPDVSADLDVYREAASVLEEIKAAQTVFRDNDFLDTAEMVKLDSRYRELSSLAGNEEGKSKSFDRFIEEQTAGTVSKTLFYTAALQATKMENEQLAASRLIECAPLVKEMVSAVREHREASTPLIQSLGEEATVMCRAYATIIKKEADARIVCLGEFNRLSNELVMADPAWTNLVDQAMLFERSRLQKIDGLAALGDVAAQTPADLVVAFGRRLEGPPQNSSFDQLVTVLAERNTDLALSLKDRTAICQLRCCLVPDDDDLKLSLAQHLEACGRHQEAEPIYARLCDNNPEVHHLTVALAQNLEKQGNVKAAEARFRGLLTHRDSLELSTAESWLQFAARHGSMQTVADELRPLFAQRGEGVAFSRILANTYVCAEQWNSAIGEWKTILGQQNTLSNQLDYCSILRDPDRCLDAVTNALSQFPDSAALSTQRAWALLNKGRIEEAGKVLHALNIQDVPWYLVSTWIQYARASNDSAQRPLELAVIEGKEQNDILLGLDMYLQGHYQECLALLEKHPNPEFPYLNLLRGFCYDAVGNYAKAEALVNEIDQNYGGLIPDAIVLKFLLKISQGDEREAQRSLDRIGALLTPTTPEYLFYQCLYEARFGWWWKARQLKRDCDEAFASDLHAMQVVWMLPPDSVERYQKAGRPPIQQVAMAIGFLGCVVWVGQIRRRRMVKRDCVNARPEDECRSN